MTLWAKSESKPLGAGVEKILDVIGTKTATRYLKLNKQ